MTRRPRSRQAGLTLVELMITIIIAGLVTTSTFMFFVGQQRVYETQAKVLNLQQNLWASMELVSRYARAAGNGMLGCVRPDTDPTGTTDNGDPPPVSNAADTTDVAGSPLARAPATGLRAWYSTGEFRIPPIWVVDGGATNPDSLTIAYGDGSYGNWSDNDLAATMPINTPSAAVMTQSTQAKIFPDPPAATPTDFMIIFDQSAAPANMARGCTLLQITNVDIAGNQIEHGVASLWNPQGANGPGMVPFAYNGAVSPPATTGAIRYLGKLKWFRFWIDRSNSVPRLMMEDRAADPANVGVIGQSEPVAEGIEDLQVTFACDNAPLNGTIETAEWIFDNENAVPAPGVAGNCNHPTMIRITLVARSEAEDTLLREHKDRGTNFLEAVENRQAKAADAYRRRYMTTTIFPRN